MSKKLFSDLPAPIKKFLRDQLNTSLRLHDASGIRPLECFEMVHRANEGELERVIAKLETERE